ncbi:MAG: glycoside hydrolase family 16 protein [Lewinellaceae bacterium]|nr:glycoside hydrolase family 16 protein [Lewinellaceae bacterium]
MKKILVCLFVIAGIVQLNSCNKNDSLGQSEDPANLVLDVQVSETGSGMVTILAQAENTTEYRFDLGDPNVAPTIQAAGNLTHTYSTTGWYDIEVWAYGSSGRYVKKNDRIFVQVGPVVNPFDPAKGYSTPLQYAGMHLVWQDEFNGSALNAANWTYDIGNGCPNLCGWGNNELEYYRAENSWVADGVLTLEARQENYQGYNYTSAKIHTQNKFSFKYGRVDIRAQLPKGQGIWPALWMLGKNISSVGWPASGEIDIMEMIGGQGRDNQSHGTIHWDQNGTKADMGKSYTLSQGIFADEFHVFSLVWDDQEISWLVDDQKFLTADITSTALSEFQQEFWLIFNVAVGGNWPGSPNATTQFPQRMTVDYVRVFQKI